MHSVTVLCGFEVSTNLKKHKQINSIESVKMARGAEGKLRQRNKKKEDKMTADALLSGNENSFMEPVTDDDFPGPSTVTGHDDDDDVGLPPPKMEKKKKKNGTIADNKAVAAAAPVKKGIKSTPLILLILMTGSTLLPAMIFASDYLGTYMQKNNLMGSIGYRLGIGQTPKKRVMSFYEKHDPEKILEVPDILSKYYGDYPKLIKRLERKYQDYGYFIDWEGDEAPMQLALEQFYETRQYMFQQWQLYAPQPIKTATRNIKYNVSTLYKKFAKVWKKKVWPLLEPILGVPKGSSAQKRKDSKAARDRKRPSGTRRKNTEYRDDEEETVQH